MNQEPNMRSIQWVTRTMKTVEQDLGMKGGGVVVGLWFYLRSGGRKSL